VVKIGTRLRELRLQKFLTQQELADASGISMRSVSQIERNRVEPHITTMRKLAKGLGVEPTELLKED
jgi:transcriptional regulator with XRE-family HTH domain